MLGFEYRIFVVFEGFANQFLQNFIGGLRVIDRCARNLKQGLKFYLMSCHEEGLKIFNGYNSDPAFSQNCKPVLKISINVQCFTVLSKIQELSFKNVRSMSDSILKLVLKNKIRIIDIKNFKFQNL